MPPAAWSYGSHQQERSHGQCSDLGAMVDSRSRRNAVPVADVAAGGRHRVVMASQALGRSQPECLGRAESARSLEFASQRYCAEPRVTGSQSGHHAQAGQHGKALQCALVTARPIVQRAR